MENYRAIFDKLWAHSEHEVVEFKEAKQSFGFEDLGKYISALSNEANLRDEPYAWMIFGVSEKTAFRNLGLMGNVSLSGKYRLLPVILLQSGKE